MVLNYGAVLPREVQECVKGGMSCMDLKKNIFLRAPAVSLPVAGAHAEGQWTPRRWG